jgi:hypothetical protein
MYLEWRRDGAHPDLTGPDTCLVDLGRLLVLPEAVVDVADSVVDRRVPQLRQYPRSTSKIFC